MELEDICLASVGEFLEVRVREGKNLRFQP